MSERGSFTTEYISCGKCFDQAQRVLLNNDKFLRSIVIPGWIDGTFLPIIAGKIGGLSAGEELLYFEYDLMPLLAVTLCHPLRIAVLAENGERFFTVVPSS